MDIVVFLPSLLPLAYPAFAAKPSKPVDPGVIVEFDGGSEAEGGMYAFIHASSVVLDFVPVSDVNPCVVLGQRVCRRPDPDQVKRFSHDDSGVEVAPQVFIKH